jgi:hypothetical protein
MDAVNEGNIFRFLTKPCEKEVLGKAITTGLVQYRLVAAEKELLEHPHGEHQSIDGCPECCEPRGVWQINAYCATSAT